VKENGDGSGKGCSFDSSSHINAAAAAVGRMKSTSIIRNPRKRVGRRRRRRERICHQPTWSTTGNCSGGLPSFQLNCNHTSKAVS